MEERTTNGNIEVRDPGRVSQPRAITNQILDRMGAGGFRPAVLSFMNRVGDVQVATADDIEVRHIIQHLHDEWLSAC